MQLFAILYSFALVIFAIFLTQSSASITAPEENALQKLVYLKTAERVNKHVKYNFLHKPEDEEVAIVEDCFYDHSWLIDKSHPCHVIAYKGRQSTLFGRKLKMRILFQDMIERDRADKRLVRECFYKHRYDSHQACWNISWGGRDLLGNTKLSHREARMKKFWHNLIKEDHLVQVNCRDHPWLEFEECQRAFRREEELD